MSLDLTFTRTQPTVVFDTNITHNLNKMADEAGIYGVLWRPEENGIACAGDMIPVLEKGLADLIASPERFKQFDAINGLGGLYIHFVSWVETVLGACREYPDATVEANR